MPTVTESLTAYLNLFRTGSPDFGIDSHNDPSLLSLWSPGMETQLQADPSQGTPIEGRKGSFVDKFLNEFWHIRIPKNTMTDRPEFEDYQLTFPPALFSIGVGMTGWNWQDKSSVFVAFDFDAIAGHALGVGVSDAELDAVRKKAKDLPFITLRRSTRGSGYHLYAMLKDFGDIKNHTEHAALARAVLGMMSSQTSFDFAARIDACGGNTWIAHKHATTANQG